MINQNEIAVALSHLQKSGGRLTLPIGEYTIDEPVVLDTPSIALVGETWAYSLDPNGVFETSYGTKLRLRGNDHAAISIGVNALPAGALVRELGIQGDLVGMDTRTLFQPDNASSAAGLFFGHQRVDQGEFSKVSCCGLACGISAADHAELDACSFNRLNLDGCCVGVYFAPNASFYTRFEQCIVADNPSYGFYADGGNASGGKLIHNLQICGNTFVRNCGANHLPTPSAAVYLNQISYAIFRDNIIDNPGVFWYFPPTATTGKDKTVYRTEAIGLYVVGNDNVISNNVFRRCGNGAIRVEGNRNTLMNNVTDGDVILTGEGNLVNGLAFAKEDARLILKGSAASTTTIFATDPSRILSQPD